VKTARSIVLMVVCGLALCGNALTAMAAPEPGAREIAAKPELVASAIRDRNAGDSAATVVQALTAVLSSDWSEAKKREQVIALIAYAVAAKGTNAAPMMGLVAAGVPPAWLPVVAATAVVASGDNSPAVADAILAAVAGNAALAEACRAACANPSSVLSPAEIVIIRDITLPEPAQVHVKAPPLPTTIRPAEKYSGQ
jgi:hypothetical protein